MSAPCDIIDEGPRFCAKQFGIHHVATLGTPAFPTSLRFDLIYLISVFTHSPVAAHRALLDQVVAALAPGGLLVFTAQSESYLDFLGDIGPYFVHQRNAIENALKEKGYFYGQYPHYLSNYGVALHSRSFIEQLTAEQAPDLRLTHYGELEASKRQDLFVYQRKP